MPVDVVERMPPKYSMVQNDEMSTQPLTTDSPLLQVPTIDPRQPKPETQPMQHKPHVERLAKHKLKHKQATGSQVYYAHFVFVLLFFINAFCFCFLLGPPASVVLPPRLQGPQCQSTLLDVCIIIPHSGHQALRPTPPNAPQHIFEQLARHNDCRLCKTWLYIKESQKHCPGKALDVAASHHLKAQK